MTTVEHPRVTVGVPVYNGQDYLAEALESLLAQDYPNLDILISDNASTDDTERVGREYAQAHASIRYVRQPENLGASGNFDTLRKQADTEYFFWAGAHDLWEPQFTSELVSVLEQDPELISVYPAGRFLEPDGTRSERMGTPHGFRNDSAARRYIRMVVHCQLYMLYGVFRLQALKDITFWSHCLGPDIMQVNHLSLKGKIAGVDKELFYMRREAGYGSAAQYFAKLQMPFNRQEVFRRIWGYQRNHVRLAFMELPFWPALGVSLLITPILFVKSLRLYAGLITEAFAPRLMEKVRSKIRCR